MTSVCTHPTRLEAVTLMNGGGLARWALTDPPHILLQVQTGFTSLKDMTISPDGNLVVVLAETGEGEETGNLQVRSWDDLTLVDQVSLGIDRVTISADGRLISGTMSGLAWLFDRETGKISRPKRWDITEGHTPFFAPSAPLVAIAGGSFYGEGRIGMFRLDGERDAPPLYMTALPNNLPWYLAFSPNSRWMVALSTHDIPSPWQVTLTLYDVEYGSREWSVTVGAETAGTRPWNFPAEDGDFYDKPIEVVFRGDEEVLFGAPKGRLLGFSRANGQMIRNISLPPNASLTRGRHARDILSFALQADQTRVWVVLRDGTFCSIPLNPLPEFPTPPSAVLPRIPASAKIPRYGISLIALSPNGEQAFVQLENGWADEADEEALVQILDCRTGEKIRIFPDPAQAPPPHRAVYSPDGAMIAVDTGEEIVIYEACSGAERCVLPGKNRYGGSSGIQQGYRLALFAFAPDGRHFLTSGEAGSVCLWETERGHKALEIGENIQTAVFSREGAYLVTVSRAMAIMLWDVRTGRLLKRMGNPLQQDTEAAVIFLNQDRWVCVLDLANSRARNYDIETGEMVREVGIPASHGEAAVFSPDGRWLVTGSRELVLWDCETWRSVCSLKGHHHFLNGISFAAEKAIVATCCNYSTLLWELEKLPPAEYA